MEGELKYSTLDEVQRRTADLCKRPRVRKEWVDLAEDMMLSGGTCGPRDRWLARSLGKIEDDELADHSNQDDAK